MSSGPAGPGAVYSPLPQSVLDSDTSEEEILISNIHHSSITNRKPVVSLRYTINKANGQNMGDYRQLGYENEADNSANGAGLLPHHHVTLRDDVRILKPEDEAIARRREPMGALRTLLFGFSIFLCFFTVITFLWVIPCDWAICPHVAQKPNTRSWERVLNRLELKGSISVVPGVGGRGRNLVMMGRCKIINDTLDIDATGMECADSKTDGGLISLVGSNGAIAWWKPLRALPSEMDCSLMDVTGDGVDDCIVVGEKGLLTAIEPISGTSIWNLHMTNRSMGRATKLDFPIVLPDLNGDGINELLTSCSIANDSSPFPADSLDRNTLILVSGRSGAVMGQPFTILGCVRVHSLNINKNLNISYVCEDADGRDSSRLTSFKELYSMIMNQSNLNIKNLRAAKLKQHKSLGRTKQVNGATKIYSYNVNGRHLTLENRGRCPLHCGVTVRVIDQRLGANEVVWNYTAENMYAMVPATLLFTNHTLANGTILTEPISGFVLKFWQWNYILHEDLKAESATSSNALFRNRLRRNARYGRGILPPMKHSSNASVHQLKERVVLITFNATDMHIVNASQNEVIQLCTRTDTMEEIVCQPDLEFQEQSLLIADLDQDSSQELVSYYTTYVSYGKDEVSGPWKLQSKVRAIRLEAELPKLYEVVSQQ